mmetsp:Transcript_53279/g.161283  ORF Transcript_53279/g.161283 Transcript_53279/m.161283 type:complete len:94 (-) Transcript_53279:6-287(-)
MGKASLPEPAQLPQTLFTFSSVARLVSGGLIASLASSFTASFSPAPAPQMATAVTLLAMAPRGRGAAAPGLLPEEGLGHVLGFLTGHVADVVA